MIDDEVRLLLPADPAYGRVARITASSLALRLGLPFPRIDDLRLAIDEALVLLLRAGVAGLGDGASDGSVSVRFTVGADHLAVDLEVSDPGGSIQGPDDESRFSGLVAPLVDVGELRDDGRVVHLETRY